MSVVLYRSLEDGQLYTEEALRAEYAHAYLYERILVRDTITLTPQQLCGPNDIVELLFRAGMATSWPPPLHGPAQAK